MVLMAVSLSCCSGRDTDAGLPEGGGQWEGGEVGDQTLLVLRILPLDTRAADQEPVEKVRTLRVVIVNKGDETDDEKPGVIECNRFITLPDIVATGLEYTLTWPTVPGPKQIYVFANEESVKDDKAQGLTGILDGFKENDEPDDFIAWAEDFSFAPQYNEEEDGSIHLPYTSYYDNLDAKPGEVNRMTAYLVPVATKFLFRFTNELDVPVTISEISVKKINESNYLCAHVEEEDVKKTLYGEGDKEFYWIDWLAKVAELSHDNLGALNQDFNSLYGWISHYKVPDEETGEGRHFFIEEDTKFDIPQSPSEDEKGSAAVGPIYVPESKNLFTYLDDKKVEHTEQRFYLTLKYSANGKTAPDFVDIPIHNLSALFRNTFVIINVNMSGGNIEAYAEIASWNRKSANGWVTEGSEPDPNPFTPPSNE